MVTMRVPDGAAGHQALAHVRLPGGDDLLEVGAVGHAGREVGRGWLLDTRTTPLRSTQKSPAVNGSAATRLDAVEVVDHPLLVAGRDDRCPGDRLQDVDVAVERRAEERRWPAGSWPASPSAHDRARRRTGSRRSSPRGPPGRARPPAPRRAPSGAGRPGRRRPVGRAAGRRERSRAHPPAAAPPDPARAASTESASATTSGT